MATIAQIVAQIRTAIYGRDVRENIAQGIEKCYDDVTDGVTLAETASTAANTAATNANTAKNNANTAATNANTAKTNADNAALAANSAAVKINNMTVAASQLATGQTPTATISEVSGHKHIAFGIPKGDTGSTPDFSVGTVTTVSPNESAAVTIDGTAANPVLNFQIPRGYDGSSIMSNRIWECTTAASTAAKTVTSTAQSFVLEEGGLYIINFDNANTADNPTLNIDSTGAKSIYINGEQITSNYTKNLIAGVCLMVYDGTNYNLVGNFYNASEGEFVKYVSQALSDAQKTQARTNIGSASDTEVVKNVSQTLSDAQKTQARTNIGSASDTEVVKNVSQTLSDTQKTQVRTNIGAADDSTVVKHSSQSLTTAQKTQARTNIGAASTADVSAITTVTTVATLSPQSNRLTDRGSHVFKFGNLVFVGINFEVNAEIGTDAILYTIPSGYRPSGNQKPYTMMCGNGEGAYATSRAKSLNLASNGDITQSWSSHFKEGGYMSAIFIYTV